MNVHPNNIQGPFKFLKQRQNVSWWMPEKFQQRVGTLDSQLVSHHVGQIVQSGLHLAE